MSGLSTEVEDEGLVVQTEDSTAVSSKKPMRSYTREFLLSLSELEVCKKLPEGFDASLLSEFDCASDSFQDRRVPGNSSVQGYKRAEYGSSVPGRGDSGSRGLDRWDNRSSGRIDTDTDSESGRRYVSQPRRSWQSPEHDGLLGSGSFPRPSGYTAGDPVPRFRPNDNVQLKRSNEPYHPPRPYKAGPHSRRETNDSFNDETFGSVDDSSEDRVEEEKKRRAEFELMRKEQHKAFQEKQKSNQGKTEDPFSDISDLGLLDNPSDSKTSNGLDKISIQAPQDESIKVSVPSQAPPSRPLVPPGFVSSVDKSSTSKSFVHPESLEIGKLNLEESHQNMKNKAQARGFSSLHSHTSGTSDIKADKMLDLPSVLQDVDHTNAPRLPDVSEVLSNGEIIGLDFEVSGSKILDEPAHSTSIFDKLFGKALTTNNGSKSNVVEDDPKTEDIWSTNTVQSKFSHWFPEEERKHLGNTSFENPNTLLSLIAGGEKGGSNVSDISSIGSIVTPEKVFGHKLSNLASSTTVNSDEVFNSYVTEAKPAVMTCEDLEQSMLSEISEVGPNSRPAENEHHALEVKVRHHANSVDNQASQHLLSLLQKGSGSKDTQFASVEEQIPDKSLNQEVGEFGALGGSVNDADGFNSSAKTLTLESLFGTAFMKELHSAQKNIIDSATINALGGTLFPPVMNGDGHGNVNNHLAPNAGISTLDKVGEWLGFNDAFQQVEQFKHTGEVDSKFNGVDGGIQATLPEEDSLINLIGPNNLESPMLVPNSGSSKLDLVLSSSSIPVDILDKLAALGGTPRDERSMLDGHNPYLLRGGMLNSELPFQNLHPQASSTQLHASQMNHNRPLFHALDSHRTHLDPQLNFMSPATIIRREAPTHHQLPPNIGHPSLPHPGPGLPGFDRPMSPLLQQMHMAGNHPPPHLGRGFPGAAPMPPHPSHNPTNYIQEPNSIQNFPFGQRQSYFGGPGIGPTGPELGVADSPPEAFQRLMEMELRANPKQMHLHRLAAGGPKQAMYGQELDTGFRNR